MAQWLMKAAPGVIAPVPATPRFLELSDVEVVGATLSERYKAIFAKAFSAEQIPADGVFGQTPFFDLCFYVRHNGSTIAFCHGELNVDLLTGYIVHLGTDPSARRLGAARTALRATCGELIERGASRITVHVESTNESARSLYTSEGFVRVDGDR